MRKGIISEGFENRLQELAGIMQENSHKIMNIGFSEEIANYLVDLDKKRGLFFADSLTRQYIKDKGLSDLEGLNIKNILSSINQKELFEYIRSREGDILISLDWIKQNAGQVNLKDFANFNDLVEVSVSQLSPTEEEIGFNSEIENYLRELDYDFGVDIGIIALKGYFKHEHPDVDVKSINLSEMAKSINQSDFYRFLRENENEISVITDWINSTVRQVDEGPLTKNFLKDKNFQNLGDALFVANDWHTNLKASGRIMDHKAGRVIERYSDGFYWKDLDTNNSPDEGQAMGHCGRDSRATTLLSLRDSNNEPHVTIAYNEDTKNVGQVKGKGNKKPIDKYMFYVNDFLGKLVKNDKLESFNWSYPVYGPDLNKEEVDGILSNMSAKARFKLAKKGVIKKIGGGNLGVRY